MGAYHMCNTCDPRLGDCAHDGAAGAKSSRRHFWIADCCLRAVASCTDCTSKIEPFEITLPNQNGHQELNRIVQVFCGPRTSCCRRSRWVGCLRSCAYS